MSDLDTTLDADLAGIRALAAWLRDGSDGSVAAAARALGTASEDDGTWSGTAATAFRDRMRSVRKTALESEDALAEAAGGLDRFAGAVDGLRSRIGSVRADAAAAGLTLTDSAVLRPAAAGPAAPAVAAGAPPAEVAAHQQAAVARSTAVAQDAAFDQAAADMQAVRSDQEAIEAELDRAAAAIRTLLIPAFDFTLGAGAAAKVDLGVDAMRGRADDLLKEAQRLTEATERPGAADFPEQLYDDLDRAAALRAKAATLLDDADRLARVGKAGGWVIGGAMAGVSTYLDMQAGESAGQAVASNLGGLVTSVVVGGAVGTFVGGAIGSIIPGAGTAVGAVAGAAVGAVVGGAVGIFTSGTIDGLWENDGDVGTALQNGLSDLKDTGTAMVDLAKQGIEWELDVAKASVMAPLDAWRSIFG